MKWLVDLTVRLVDLIKGEIALVDFWQNAARQEELRGDVFRFLDENELVDFDRADQVADRLLELAKANSHKLVGS